MRILTAKSADERIANLKGQIRTHPSYRAYLLLAEAYIDAGDNSAARQVLNQNEVVNAGSVTVVDAAELTGIYRRLGEYDRALRLCAMVLNADQFLVTTLNNCGATSFLSGNIAVAERLLIRAVETAPDEPAPVYWLGRVDLQNGRLQDAQSELRKAIELNSQVPDYHYWLGRCMETAGDPKQAQEEYRLAATLEKPDAKILIPR
jgi:FimV-like protein